MSEIFAVKGGKPISYGDFLGLVNQAEFRDVDDPPEDVTEPLSGIRHFYVDEVSCRGIEIEGQSDGVYTVRINMPSSVEDWQLGLQVTKALAEHFGAKIEAPGKKLTLEAFSARYDDAWIKERFDDMALSQACELKDGYTITIDGAIRPFHLGNRTASAILENRSKKDAAQEWMDRVRKAQYVDPEFFVPKIYRLAANEQSFAIFAPELSIVYPWVQYVVLPDGDDQFYIPYETLISLLGDRVTWLDDKQTLVTSVPEEEWSQFIQKALPHAVDMDHLLEQGVTEILTTARRRYNEQVAAAEAEDEDEE
jgi:hypothetical protein